MKFINKLMRLKKISDKIMIFKTLKKTIWKF